MVNARMCVPVISSRAIQLQAARDAMGSKEDRRGEERERRGILSQKVYHS